MLQRLKHTVKHSAIYSIGNLIVKLTGLLLLPIYTTHLTTAQYGILSILEVSATFLTAIFSLNLANAMMRWWADSNSQKERKSYIFTAFIGIVFFILVLNASLQPFSKNFAKIFFSETKFTIYFNILFLTVSFNILNKFTFSLLRILEKSTLYIIVNSIKFALMLTLNIIFIVSLNMGVKGIILSQLIGHATGFFLLLPLLLKNLIVKFQTDILKNMLNYSIPLAFTALSSVFFNMGDRYVLKFLTDDSRVGIYTLAYKIAGFLNFFVLQSFQMAFLPIAYKMYKQKNSKRFFSKVYTYLIIILTFGALGISLFSNEVLYIFAPDNKNYWEAAFFVPFILITVILWGVRYLYSIHFHISKKTKLLPFFVISIALVNIFLNFITIPKWGIMGAIFSSIVSTLILNTLYHFVGKKYYYVKYELGKNILIFLLGVVLFSISLLLKDFNFVLKVVFKSGLLFLFPGIIFLGGFLEPVEKERIIQSWHKWKNPKKWKSNFKK